MSPEQIRNEAYQRYQAGDTATAARLCEHVLRLDPRHAEAVYLLGVIAQDAGRIDEAAELIGRAAALAAENAVFRNALGEVQLLQGKQAEALASFRQAVLLRPTYERAHNNVGRMLHTLGDLAGAQASFVEAVRLNPSYPTAHNNLGAMRQAQGQFDAAAKHFRQAITLRPQYPEAHFNLGTIFQVRGDPASAATHFRQALAFRPNYPRAHHALGRALEGLGQLPAALPCYLEAVRLKPDFAEAHHSLGDLLLLKPDWEAARAAFERTLELQPTNADAFARLVFTRQVLCDWSRRDTDFARLWNDCAHSIATGKQTPVLPFCSLTLPWSPAQQLAVARSHSDAIAKTAALARQILGFHPLPREPAPHLRIGYLSCEFRDHAVSHLVQGIFGLHDRRKVEVFAYSFGPDDGSTYRRRIERDCDHFRDLRVEPLADAARRIHADRLHILVDLQGWVGYPRMTLMALRPATIQVNYLGHPGTTGADFIDYFLGDPITTPPDQVAAYCEKLVTLPHTYLATDNGQPIAESAGTRADHGLPDGATVFCGFNNSYKIEPELFDAWMRILHQVSGSVLWLTPVAPPIERNLRREAEARQVDPQRLVFARRMPGKAEHLARHRLADLFLDTWIYNGHTTAADALWAGLPVLTCPGETFVSRVGASLLTAVGLPELIAPDRRQYEETAVRLGNNRDELRSLRTRLEANRTTWPLFDTPGLVRNLEKAYRVMWDLYVSGEAPRSFAV